MINRVILTGRLTNDVELRQTNDGTAFTYFTVAVNRQNSGNNNSTDFVPCVAWRGQAELLKNYLHKGSLIGIEGRLEVFTTQQDGQYKTRINVNVSQIHFLEPKRNSNNNVVNQDFSNVSFDQEIKKNEQNLDNSSEINFDEIDFDNIKF